MPLHQRGLKEHQENRFVPYVLKAELSILQVATANPTLTDQEVRESLRQLARALKRSGPATASLDGSAVRSMSENMADVIGQMALTSLAEGLDEQGPLPVEDLIGILGTIRSSINTWSYGPRSRAYFAFLAQFFEDMGIIVRPVEEGDTN